MIQAKDLRLGNLIYYKGKEIEVRTNDIGLLNEYERVGRTDDSFTPIPLTPEILEAAGFKWLYNDTYNCSEYPIFSMEKLDDGWSFTMLHNYESITLMLIEYVHHFQNFYFAMTSEELTINLNDTTSVSNGSSITWETILRIVFDGKS